MVIRRKITKVYLWLVIIVIAITLSSFLLLNFFKPIKFIYNERFLELKDICMNGGGLLNDGLSYKKNYSYYFSICKVENILDLSQDKCDDINFKNQEQSNVELTIKCAIITKNVSFCDNIVNNRSRDDCYSEIKVDPAICETIEKLNDKYECLARAKDDLSYCDYMEREDYSLSCKAELGGDVSYCDKIENKVIKDDCHEIFRTTFDCNYIGNQFSKYECLATKTKNEDYCKKAAEISCNNDAYLTLSIWINTTDYCDFLIPDDGRDGMIEVCKRGFR